MIESVVVVIDDDGDDYDDLLEICYRLLTC